MDILNKLSSTLGLTQSSCVTLTFTSEKWCL